MIAKAQLVEIRWLHEHQTAEPTGNDKATVDVQFNPETLKLTYTNQNAGGDQPGGSSKQFVGSGTSKLSVDLLFDTSVDGTDVRKQTQKVAHYIKAKAEEPAGSNKRVPPGVSFEWGSFVFPGVVDSMSETLDYFSEDGHPLRSTVSLGITRQEIEFYPKGKDGAYGGPGAPGSQPLDESLEGDSVRSVAARNNRGDDWKRIARANDIDNPLRVPPGRLLDTRRRV